MPPLFAIVLLFVLAMNAKAQTGFTCPCAGGANSFNLNAGGRLLSTIPTAELPSTPLPPGSCLAILGQLIVDIPYTIDGSTLLMQPGAEIVVELPIAGDVLTIQNSRITGCEQMWRAITVRRGELFFDNNDISDAQWAIRAGCGLDLTAGICPGNRTLTITRSRFDRNHIGVQTRFTPSGISMVNYTSTTHSNAFTCSANLLPNFDNAAVLPNFSQINAYAAFDINSSLDGFNIGSANPLETTTITSGATNGIRNGILVRRCNGNINILNVDIVEPVGGVGMGAVSLTNPQGIGILLNATEAVHTAFITDCSTQGADRGIHSVNSRFVATGNTFDKDFIAIRHNGVRPVNISNNQFTGYEFMGIRVELANQITNLLIDDNTFTHNHALFQNPTITPNSTAIAIIGNNSTVGGSGTKIISNNTLNIDAQDVAISVMADARYIIAYNDVFYGNGGAGFSNQQGIIDINGDNNSLFNNDIVEDMDTKPGNSYTIIAGRRNVLCCNSTVRSSRGVYFSLNCDNSSIRHTQFGGHFRALFCDAGTIIGDQNIAANNWPTPPFPGVQNVEHLGVNLEVQGSEFLIPIPMTAPFWPDNVYTPNATVPWLIPSIGTNLDCDTDESCESPVEENEEEELTENNRIAAAGGYDHERYGVMLTWETQRSLYAKLMHNPALLGQEESIDAFYGAASLSNIADFHAIEEAAKSIGVLTEEETLETETLMAEVAEKAAALLGIEDALRETEDPEEISELESAWEALVEAIREANAEIDEIIEAEKERSQTTAASLYEQNEALEAEILPAQNEKALNRVLFEMASEGVQELSEDQFEVVSAIANQCPLDGGHSVYRARAIYALKQPGGFSDSLLCLQTQELTRPGTHGFIAQNNRTSVFPNPGANELSVRIPTDLVGNTLSLRLNTLTGQPALYFDRESAETLEKLDVSALAAGVYMLTVRVDGQVIGTHKVILIK